MKKLIKDHNSLRIDHCLEDLKRLVQEKEKLLTRGYGLEKNCREEFLRLPEITPSAIDLSSDTIRIGDRDDISDDDFVKLNNILESFSPWRKGPFNLFGIDIDTEWASWMKWNRLKDKITHLNRKRILDIGCSSGYYMLRMLEQKPSMVLGIDPQILFYYQFLTFQKYLKIPELYYIPATMEELPHFQNYFDTIFSMGILYHRKSPVEALQNLHRYMKTGGELILETLIVEGDSDTALFPVDRYAKMNNVYFIPTVKCLESWLMRAKFKDIETIDISPTTIKEQRKTKWIKTESLSDFLDPSDPSKTVEGYPAPVRVVIKATSYKN